MRPQIQFLRIIPAATLLCASPFARAQPPISYEGGDGSSREKAVIIKGGNEESGVGAEYAYLRKHYPGCKIRKQALSEAKGKSYDSIEFTTADGKPMTIYFDITDFFGK